MPINKARSYFPRGLHQPPGSFRFSADALLLAGFAAQCLGADNLVSPDFSYSSAGQDHHAATPQKRLLDLGCGCGVVAFGVLLQHPDLQACGVDMQPELLEAAARNAALLGFEGNYCAIRHDLTAGNGPFGTWGGTRGETRAGSRNGSLPDKHGFHLITANPPYRLPGSGRQPAASARRAALFGDRKNLEAFMEAGAANLHPTGSFCIIFPWERQEELLLCLDKNALQPARGVTIHPHGGSGASLLLLQAKRRPAATLPPGLPGPRLPETPPPAQSRAEPLFFRLVLHEKGTEADTFTNEALQFCPYLSCNARRAGSVAAK